MGKKSSEAVKLQAKYQQLHGGFSEALDLRVSRAISWLERAENTDDIDGRFIFLWISFNAAYAGYIDDAPKDNPEHEVLQNFFDKIIELDADNLVYDAVWEKCFQPIRIFIDNRYVFESFWKYHNGIDGYQNWEQRFKKSTKHLKNHLEQQNTAAFLEVLFGRLYTLRNQLIHGGATWNSKVNRDQVRDGRRILESLMPVFIELMMEHPNQDWGKPWYPRLEDG